MKDGPTRALSVLAACWALPYVGSKVEFALQGRLGVHGGPHATAADYAGFDGTAAVSTAQWGNAAIGSAILLAGLVPATALARRLNRWVVAVPLLVAGAMQAVATTIMAAGAMAGRGGWPFCVYTSVWASILVALALRSLVARSRRARTVHDLAGSTS